MAERKESDKFTKVYQPGDVIFQEGKLDHDFCCLLGGKVTVWKEHEKDGEKKSVRVGEMSDPGAYFGEMSFLLDEDKCTATIIAEDEVKVLKLPGEKLPEMIQKQPKLALKLCMMLADRVKGTTAVSQEFAAQRDELRDDGKSSLDHAQALIQKVFVLLSAVQTQYQVPVLPPIIEMIFNDKLFSKKLKVLNDPGFIKSLPEELATLVKKTFADKIHS